MTSERHARAKRLFQSALEREPSERAYFLDAECAGDDDLRRQVEAMLAVDGRDSFLHGGPLPLQELFARAPSGLPDRLGGFRILEKLGEGGHATVFEAEQERPRRRVAIKVLHPGLATPKMLRRFELESELLGLLQHPGIARIYEAGSTDTGHGPQPWFAMELVDGVPLTRYAEEHDLSLEARLALVARVCDVVQHAHQRGIVHRDLKPANILVDASGAPKVLDFGVARATDADLRPATLETGAGQVIGTLQYMSPEQAAGDSSAIDARSDVYSLGVILYEVVAGVPPVDLGDAPIVEVLRRVIEDDPRPFPAGRRVPQDVALVARKALEKDRERRYPSASALADDLRRYLRREPVTAQPPTTWYLARRFAARNRVLVGGVAATFLALVAGLAATLWQVRETTRAEKEAREGRAKAEDALARARAIREFLLSDLLASPVPERLGADARIVDVLGPAEQLAEQTFADWPLVAAEVLETVGGSYTALGLYTEGQGALRRALALLEDDPDDLVALRARGRLISAISNLGRLDEARVLAESVVAESTRLLGPEDPETLDRRTDLAYLRWLGGERAEGVAELRAAQADRTRLLGAEHEKVLAGSAQLHGFLAVSAAGEGDAARRALQDTVTTAERVLGQKHGTTLIAKERLAWISHMAGDHAGADRLYAELIPAFQALYGPGHPYVHKLLLSSSETAMKLGHVEQAFDRIRTAAGALEECLGPEHEWSQEATLLLAEACFRSGSQDEAIRLASQVVATRRATLPAGDERIGIALGKLGRSYRRAGRLDDAARAYREAIAVLKVSGERSEYVAQELYNLGVVEREAGRFDAAVAAFEELLPIDRENWGDESENVATDRLYLAQALHGSGRSREAVEELEEALRVADVLGGRPSGFDPRQRLYVVATLGVVLQALGEVERAEPLLEQALESAAELDRSDHRMVREARAALVRLLEDQGRDEEARAHAAEGG